MFSVYVYGLLASITGAFGALFLKMGAHQRALKHLFNMTIVAGTFLYLFATLFTVLGLKNSSLSFFYPFTALHYLFAVFLGFFILKEKVNRYKLAGIFLVLLGIFLDSIGR